jgi:hypothetical protein
VHGQRINLFPGPNHLRYHQTTTLEFSDIGGQTVYADIPYGRRLRLSCMIKLEDVDPLSDGVSIAIRGDDADGNGVFFYSTQGDVPIHGNEDWTK